jgi:hypothetical protein
MTISELHKESFPDFAENGSLIDMLAAHNLTERLHVLKSKQEVLHLARIVNKLTVKNMNEEKIE